MKYIGNDESLSYIDLDFFHHDDLLKNFLLRVFMMFGVLAHIWFGVIA
jgi:hypothetical protein